MKTLDGREVPCQEEQPESLLPFNGWRRKLSFMADLPQLGAARYVIDIHEGAGTPLPATPLVRHAADPATGLLRSLDAGEGRECLAGPLMLPLVVEDTGDAWGADCWRYRNVVGTFAPAGKTPVVLHDGPVRRTTETSLSHGASTIVIQTTVYPDWPVIEYRCRVHWHEEHKRLKLSFPTIFRSSSVLCEIPGGIIERPADGEEHVHGRWCMASGLVNGIETALGIVSCGQHGLDVSEGEIRLSVLRSAAYCHEKGLPIPDPPARKYMDQGVHEFRILVVAGDTEVVRGALPGLADWLSAPPAVFAHLPIGTPVRSKTKKNIDAPITAMLSLSSPDIRVMALKRTEDGKALLVRLQETTGIATRVTLALKHPFRTIPLKFSPLEIKTLRIARNGTCTAAHLIKER
jgi:alpha-mannosidase